MAGKKNSYELIQEKISSMKQMYSKLRDKADEYVFSALCVKANVFKNPAYTLEENDFEEMIVDGKSDGGVDVLVTQPDSDASDLIIAQSKFYKKITMDDVVNAVLKMAIFYKEMENGSYQNVNDKVEKRYITLRSEMGEESKIHFVFYTSASQNGIRRDRIEKKFKEMFVDFTNIDLTLLFGDDIEEEIKEAESRRPTVERGKILIDKANNYLEYGDIAVIVNASAFSIKELYAEHHNNVLSKNLRYHISVGKNIDKDIDDTIQNDSESFWFKNNGLTIICDDFEVNGKEVHLHNFSIINGGQTTYVLHKSKYLDKQRDFYVPCKVIQVIGDTEDEKNAFSLSIAKATNSQKAIKPIDLKANSPEQVRFAREMRNVGIFYQTKRGEDIPKQFKEAYLNTDLAETGKLCLSAVYQLPGKSRNKPSILYDDKYYNKIFDSDQKQIAPLCKELLYADYYYKKIFISRFDKENADSADSDTKIPLAHNARTMCIAFTALAARYHQGNIGDGDMKKIFDAVKHESQLEDTVYEIASNLSGVKYFIPPAVFANKDKCDEFLYKLFNCIINAGSMIFGTACRYDDTLNATNYLKKDINYYSIMNASWANIVSTIKSVFGDNK